MKQMKKKKKEITLHNLKYAAFWLLGILKRHLKGFYLLDSDSLSPCAPIYPIYTNNLKLTYL